MGSGGAGVLVHGYAEVDDRQVIANLAHLDDLEAFVSGVAGWLPNPG